LDPLLMRFLERIVAVLIGGLAICLGYRLFLRIPEQRDSSGKVALPWNTSIFLSRVGPGVFFALFGAIVVALGLLRPLDFKDPAGGGYSYAGDPGLRDQDVRADARIALRKEIAVLNTLPGFLRADLPAHERSAVDRSLRRTKLALVLSAWGDPEEGFGPVEPFTRWVEGDEEGAPPAGMEGALLLYRYGLPEPPR
jgi:hypothetical protein